MPKFRHIAEVQNLMSSKEFIRNIGIIAHIDHGKTTLADSLLAGTGLLSPQMAGSARVLDYLEEEQRRKITIKTANITMLYKSAGKSYIINLVDTPGHVDFTGKVTRALRAIDGSVVVVDAVEEIMAQTEVVTRQALEERVRPVLFINKVDRLITELQLNEKQIQKKFTHIITNFNNLIELYADKPFKSTWKVDAKKGSVAFGAALHGWGFTLDIAQQKNLRFRDVITNYKDGTQEKLRKILPVYDAIFSMAIANIPDPKTAQSYRIEKIWDGHTASKVGQALVACNDEGPAVICVTNVHPEVGSEVIATGRVFSGTVKKGDKMHLMDVLSETEVKQVYINMGSFREEVNKVTAGNIVTLTLTGPVRAGETLVDEAHKGGMVPFEGINPPSEAVVTIAVEPKNPQHIPSLLEALDRLAIEDPDLSVCVSDETGEHLLSGMGELHLEIALKQLKSLLSEVELVVSQPRVVYRESVSEKGIKATALSPNRQNRFTVQVEPLVDEIKHSSNSKTEESGSILSFDEHRNVLCDATGKTEQIQEEILEPLIAGFEFACRAGPLCKEPVRHIKVNLIDFELSSKADFVSAVEIMHGVGKAIFGSFLSAKPVLLEPVYRTIISVPTEMAGECQRTLSSRRGRIVSFENKGLLTTITGFVPVAETFGLSKELRSSTSGYAFWQSNLDRWEKVPEKIAPKIISEIRRRKGLPSEAPSASKFLEEK
ncbi:MAG: GTP-binding protein [Candidatus Bathyarchaeota archaeon]|nr:GTP-binding protein [Candidatus Bathyarchaeota archaeon]